MYTIDAEEIPAQLSDAKKLILTGTWSQSKLQALSLAIGNNTGFPPVGNSTIEEIDMSQAKIEANTYAYLSSGYGVFRGLNALVTVKDASCGRGCSFQKFALCFPELHKSEEHRHF